MEEASIDPPAGENGMLVATFPSNRPEKTTRRVQTEELCSATSSASHVREDGNPATPGRPDDLKVCDLTAMEGELLGVMYATDDWVEPEWGENVTPRNTSGLTKRQRTVGKWREGNAPKSIHPRIQPFLKNSLCTNPEGQ